MAHLSEQPVDTEVEGERIQGQAVVRSGATRRLVELLMHRSHEVKAASLRAVGHIVAGDEAQMQLVLKCSALPCLYSLLVNPLESIRADACRTISKIAASSRAHFQLVIEANLFQQLVHVLTADHSDEVQKEALHAVCSAAEGGSDEQLRSMASAAVLPALCSSLDCPELDTVIAVLQCLERILRAAQTAGEGQHADSLQQDGGRVQLQQLQQDHENAKVREQAQWLLTTYFPPSTS